MKNTTLLFFFFLIGCRDGEGPLRSPHLQSPVITGIYLTDAIGVLIGTWGNPSDLPQPGDNSNGTGHIPLYFEFVGLYPNPSYGITTIRYDLPQATRVKIWVVRGRTTDELNDITFGGSNFFSADDLNVQIIEDRYSEAGNFSALWTRNKSIPDGFYRIYIQANNLLAWRDAAVFDPCDLPHEIQNIMNIECN
jgi:hypothetical protein